MSETRQNTRSRQTEWGGGKKYAPAPVCATGCYKVRRNGVWVCVTCGN